MLAILVECVFRTRFIQISPWRYSFELVDGMGMGGRVVGDDARVQARMYKREIKRTNDRKKKKITDKDCKTEREREKKCE